MVKSQIGFSRWTLSIVLGALALVWTYSTRAEVRDLSIAKQYGHRLSPSDDSRGKQN